MASPVGFSRVLEKGVGDPLQHQSNIILQQGEVALEGLTETSLRVIIITMWEITTNFQLIKINPAKC